MPSHVLVTGGAGFIGSTLVKLLLSRGYSVVNLDKLTYAGNLDSIADCVRHNQHKFVQGDICDAELVSDLLAEFEPSAIMHLAAESHVDRSIEGPSEFLSTNVHGTFNLLEQSLKYWKTMNAPRADRFRFLHVSTDEVYGSLGPTGAFTETSPYAPSSPYSASKAAADHFVNAYHHTYGLPTLITNCSNNYGPFQFPEKLLPVVITKASKGERIPVYGDGKNVRDWLFVEDHADALITVLEHAAPGSIYNIGGNSERTNIDVVRAICRLVDEALQSEGDRAASELLIDFVQDRPGHDRRYAIDSTKLQSELGWRPKQSFEIGLKKTVLWYLENTEWVERVTNGSYRGQRLGLLSQR